jgi:hypothetical protein
MGIAIAREPEVEGADNTASYSSSTSTPAVQGSNSDGGIGAYGIAPSYVGVVGGSTSGAGVYGATDGVSVPALARVGVWGQASGAFGPSVGVQGDHSGAGYGVNGTSAGTGGTGVNGVASGINGMGVAGECDNGTFAFGVYAKSTTGYGVRALGAGAGVWGDAYQKSGTGVQGGNVQGGTGVLGQSTSGSDSSSIGVQGQASGSSSGFGVVGKHTTGGTGVYGQSNNAIGVWGVTTTSGQGLANPAVAGTNNGGGAGLVGFTAGPSSIGLAGATTSGIGAYGSSQTGIGLFGYSNTGFAIEGVSPGGGYAGYFSGPVFVTGSLTAMGAKSAAVKTKGGLSRVYSMESPESWFEDFGSSQLTGGQITVSLEPGFADIVQTDAYHVFLTPRGEPKGPLYVSKQTPNSFTVQEAGGGTSSIDFSYRIVAKRADIEGARLEHVDEPKPQDGPQEPVLDHAPRPPTIQAPVPKSGK